MILCPWRRSTSNNIQRGRGIRNQHELPGSYDQREHHVQAPECQSKSSSNNSQRVQTNISLPDPSDNHIRIHHIRKQERARSTHAEREHRVRAH